MSITIFGGCSSFLVVETDLFGFYCYSFSFLDWATFPTQYLGLRDHPPPDLPLCVRPIARMLCANHARTEFLLSCLLLLDPWTPPGNSDSASPAGSMTSPPVPSSFLFPARLPATESTHGIQVLLPPTRGPPLLHKLPEQAVRGPSLPEFTPMSSWFAPRKRPGREIWPVPIEAFLVCLPLSFFSFFGDLVPRIPSAQLGRRPITRAGASPPLAAAARVWGSFRPKHHLSAFDLFCTFPSVPFLLTTCPPDTTFFFGIGLRTYAFTFFFLLPALVPSFVFLRSASLPV